MKKINIFIFLLLIFALTVCLVGCDINLNFGQNQGDNTTDDGKGSDSNNDTNTHAHQTVNFFTMNDIHGHLITDSDNGISAGLDKISSLLKQLEASDDYIKISNGDMFQGTMFSNTLYGLPGIEWMNHEHFDCFVLGNHEFDWGIDKIAAYKDGNLENGELNEDCEILGCNIYLKSTNAMPTWLQAYSIEECNGYKVGVIGCIGEGLTSSISASMVVDYKFVDPVPLVEEYAKKLRNEEKCDVVIVSIHEYDQGTNSRFAALSGDSRIDAIICGHSHTENSEYMTRSDGYKVPIIQCRGYNSNVGSINIKMTDGKPVSNGVIKHYTSSSYASNKEAYDLLYKYYEDIQKAGERVIGYTNNNLSREDLGMIGCDAIKEYTKADFGICNTGGIRSAIYAGTITYSDVFNVIPFDNTVFIIKIKGSDLNRAINSSLYVNIDEIEVDRIYTVAIISYVYENYNGFRNNAIEETDTSILFRDIVADYISELYPRR